MDPRIVELAGPQFAVPEVFPVSTQTFTDGWVQTVAIVFIVHGRRFVLMEEIGNSTSATRRWAREESLTAEGGYQFLRNVILMESYLPRAILAFREDPNAQNPVRSIAAMDAVRDLPSVACFRYSCIADDSLYAIFDSPTESRRHNLGMFVQDPYPLAQVHMNCDEWWQVVAVPTIFGEIARGLNGLHKLGIALRNLHPGNIEFFFDDYGVLHAQIINLESAYRHQPGTNYPYKSHEVLQFMSPEEVAAVGQFPMEAEELNVDLPDHDLAGHPIVDWPAQEDFDYLMEPVDHPIDVPLLDAHTQGINPFLSDRWSLGALLPYLLTLEPPFSVAAPGDDNFDRLLKNPENGIAVLCGDQFPLHYVHIMTALLKIEPHDRKSVETILTYL